MNCPKCNAELKPGARFCHVCGFDTQTVETPAPQPIVNPNQNQNTMEQNTTPAPEQQPQNNQGFDMNKVPKNNWIHAGIAALGAIGVFLPWVRVSFFGMSNSVSGINAWQGVLSLILLLLIGVMVVMGDSLKMPEANKKQLMSYGAYAPAAFSAWVLVDILTTPIVTPGIGLFITFAASVVLILIGHKVIKL